MSEDFTEVNGVKTIKIRWSVVKHGGKIFLYEASLDNVESLNLSLSIQISRRNNFFDNAT